MTGPTPPHESPDPPPDHAEVAFHPPFLLLAALVVGAVLTWIRPLPFLPADFALPLGIALVLAALAAFVWAFRTMVAAGASVPTSLPSDAVVEHGPYRYSRNPIYVSMVALQLGIGAWANSLWFVLLGGLSAVLLRSLVIAREERYLERKFGERYAAYRGRVRRWL